MSYAKRTSRHMKVLSMNKSDVTTDPIVKFHERVEQQILLGKTAGQATRVVVKRYPGLHRAFLQAVNAGRGPGVELQIRRRFGEEGGPS